MGYLGLLGCLGFLCYLALFYRKMYQKLNDPRIVFQDRRQRILKKYAPLIKDVEFDGHL